MDKSTKARRIYPNKNRAFICFGGGLYTPTGGETSFNLALPATRVDFESKTAGEIHVTQRLKGKKGVTEVWSRTKG